MNPPSLPSGSGYDYRVSCVSSNFCVATVLDTTDDTNAFVQVWNGSTWNAVAVPSPSGAAGALLLSVSCTSDSFCVAVGVGGTISSDFVPFADEWNGSSWSISDGPSVPDGYTNAELTGVSCTGPAWCMAVGYATNTSTGFSQALGEQWDGSAWSPSSLPAVAGSASNALSAVSCTAPTHCMAVGAISPDNGAFVLPKAESPQQSSGSAGTPFGPGVLGMQAGGAAGPHEDPHAPPAIQVLAEQWDGSSWTVSPAAAPADATDPELESVSCAGNGFCMATGLSVGASVSSFSEEWSGDTWSEIPLPASPTGGAVLLEAVSCISPTSCTTVGETTFTTDPSAGGTYVSGSWDGSGWVLNPLTAPAGTTAAVWTGISCLSAGYCVATGALATGPASSETVVPTNDQAPIGRTGYRLAAADGGVFSYGPSAPSLGAPFAGSMGGQHLNAPIVGVAPMPSGDGYYLVASDGGVFNFGSAQFYGSAGGTRLNKPVVGMAVTADGGGYWLVASDGGLFSYGDAQFYGSTGGLTLNKPIVGVAATPNGLGYYLVASDGGIFGYGNATFAGSMAGKPLNKPIVGMAVTATGGYYLVGSDGGVFNFGGAPLLGSAGSLKLNKPVVGVGVALGGYYLVGSDGGIFDYPGGGAPPLFFGSAGGTPLNAPIVGIGT